MNEVQDTVAFPKSLLQVVSNRLPLTMSSPEYVALLVVSWCRSEVMGWHTDSKVCRPKLVPSTMYCQDRYQYQTG